jgi:ATP-dependent DNA helicase RecQ
VEKEISNTIFNKPPIIIKSTFDRPNLKIIVKQKKKVLEDLYSLIESNISNKIIIYTRTRKECENIYKIINKLDIKCGIYHAGLDDNVRKNIHRKFINNDINCIIATIAFGMGIDHNINLIIRYGMPDNIESYYQEIGRAGRDNSISECYLFYSYIDYKISESINNKISDDKLKKVKEKKLNIMKYYIYTKKCRRKFILNYFNEKYNIQNCKMCDICINIDNNENNKKDLNSYCKYKFKKGLKKEQTCNKRITNNSNYCNRHIKD